jgi:hypothetical protein
VKGAMLLMRGPNFGGAGDLRFHDRRWSRWWCWCWRRRRRDRERLCRLLLARRRSWRLRLRNSPARLRFCGLWLCAARVRCRWRHLRLCEPLVRSGSRGRCRCGPPGSGPMPCQRRIGPCEQRPRRGDWRRRPYHHHAARLSSRRRCAGWSGCGRRRDRPRRSFGWRSSRGRGTDRIGQGCRDSQ